ncbi:PP2C family protein-serine/threonine phosphatase [Romeria aff. gracilis LEGE 07310]|uniref:PP2C family protein-serine/threonine phosphatase n=1 Tax=Vasconcelosia minhoensis LEGE 07310 TaxID=915328 RepID=A0A8J7DM94_9CYAN|nr:PP2C family protein-serine/threonine phosphatase [Romeria gracilis]MBE9078381.1 PP2C family protein-serine/threonine phosphatase [Romeria aff. gracilis LEGE 07310]
MPSRPTPPFNPMSGRPVPGDTPVFALKELVSRLQREQYKIQDLLSSLGFALRSLNNINQFLELIPMIASRVTDASGGALVLFHPDGQLRLERLYCSEDSDCQTIRFALESATHQITASLAAAGGTVQAARGTLQILDQRVNRYLGPDVQLFGTAIIVQKAARGRLYIFSQDSGYTWTETRQKLARLVADQTAVAIENDELTVELRKKERLDRELELGAEIQAQLLPRQCPQIEGVDLAARCLTASKVGGDYYDFIPTNYEQLRAPQSETSANRPWSFAIGDVMGKGVPAGLMMTMLRGMLRTEVLNGHSPGHILQHLNWVMHTDLENSHRFVTLFYSEYNPKTQMLAYGNAAHNPPLLWQAATNTVTRLDTDGMLLGLDIETQYQENQVQLRPGDTVIYYTDGFTDAANARGDRFDEENLVEAVRWACRNRDKAQEILTYLFEMLQHFVGADRSSGDDTTLIVMRITQPAEFRQLSTRATDRLGASEN